MFFQRSIHAAVMAAVFLCCAAVVQAQSGDCIVTGLNPTQLRSGGIAEKTGDVVIVCDGGTPTPKGQPVPTANFLLTFNAPVTSRLLASGWSEALLLINEPSPSQQRVCGTPGGTVNLAGSCAIVSGGDLNSTYEGSAGHPNVFQGMVAGPNSLAWVGVPINAGGSSEELVVRFTNLRLDVASFGPISLNQFPVAVTATLSTTGTMPAPVKNNPQQFIGQVQDGFVSSASSPTQCAPQAATLATLLGRRVAQVDLLAVKGFPASFKPRTAAPFVDDNTSPAPVNQDILGASIFFSETDFFNSTFPTLAGHGNLARAGLADQGTRIAVRIANAPPGVTLYSPVIVPASATACNLPGVARRIETNANGSGPFTATPGDAAGLAPMVEQGGVLTAVYETLRVCAFVFGEQFDIPIFADAPSLGDATAIVGLAPFGVEPKTSSLGPPPPPGNPPIPRFVLPTGPGLALTPLVCQP